MDTKSNKTVFFDIDPIVEAMSTDLNLYVKDTPFIMVNAYNKVSTEKLYSIRRRDDLVESIKAGLDIDDLHHLASRYEEDDKHYTPYFRIHKDEHVSLQKKSSVICCVENKLEDIVVAAMKNPFDFEDIYKTYVAPFIKFIEKP